MTDREKLIELLTKTDHSLIFATRDLQEAFKCCNLLEFILLEQYFKEAVALRQKITVLIGAINATPE